MLRHKAQLAILFGRDSYVADGEFANCNVSSAKARLKGEETVDESDEAEDQSEEAAVAVCHDDCEILERVMV